MWALKYAIVIRIIHLHIVAYSPKHFPPANNRLIPLSYNILAMSA